LKFQLPNPKFQTITEFPNSKTKDLHTDTNPLKAITLTESPLTPPLSPAGEGRVRRP